MSQLYTCRGAVATSSGHALAGCRASRRRSVTCACSRQHPVHRGHRTQIDALVEQLGVDLQRRQVDEPVAGEHLRTWPPFGRGELVRRRPAGRPAGVAPGRRRAAGSRSSGPARSIVAACPGRYPVFGQLACRWPSALLALLVGVRALGDVLQESVCFSHDVQRGLGGAPAACLPESSSPASRAISACSAVSLPTFSPGCLPASTPASRCLRHSLINDEYRPSRRR